MIFDCPRCEAENAIPVADIPPEGKVAMCSGCKQPFRVLPPDPDELDEPDDTANFEANAENTTVGAPPAAFDEGNDDPTGGYFVPPVHTSGSQPLPEVEPPLIARDTSDLPPEVLGGGSGAAALEVSGTDDTLLPADGRTLGRRLRGRLVDDRTPPSGTPAILAPPVARTTATPPATPLAAPSGSLPFSPVGAALPVAAAAPLPLLQRIPLAAKVGAAVFPIALGIALLARPGASPTDTAPIALPVAPQVPTATAAISPPPSPPAPRPTVPPEALAHAPLAHDQRAEEGYQYVVAESLALRARAGAGGSPVEQLKRGTRVRVVQWVEDAALVWVEPTGPAGFAAVTGLDERLPISALADAIAFQGCGERATCTEAARDQATRCATSCTAEDAQADEVLRDRCREACTVARTRCERTCETARAKKK